MYAHTFYQRYTKLSYYRTKTHSRPYVNFILYTPRCNCHSCCSCKIWFSVEHNCQAKDRQLAKLPTRTTIEINSVTAFKAI